jgi:hypothetical protein
MTVDSGVLVSQVDSLIPGLRLSELHSRAPRRQGITLEPQAGLKDDFDAGHGVAPGSSQQRLLSGSALSGLTSMKRLHED